MNMFRIQKRTFFAASIMSRSVKAVVTATKSNEGRGVNIHRSLGGGLTGSLEPFKVFDHFSIATGGFPEHPHRGQETVTLLLTGRIAHEDFTGKKGILYPGDLQFMTAGRGIIHSEMAVPDEDGTPASGIQLWVDLPNEMKCIEPRYRDLRAWEVPSVSQQAGDVVVKVISGSSYGVGSTKELAYIPMEFYHVKLKNSGVYTQEVGISKNFSLYVISGAVKVNGQTITPHQNVFFNQDGGDIIAINEGEPTELVLIGGEVLNQTSIQKGFFVAETLEEIKQAYTDYRKSQNGFELRATWKTLISQGVTQEMIDGPLNGSTATREKQRLAYEESIKT